MAKFSKKDIKTMKKLRLKYKIINFFWSFAYKIEIKLRTMQNRIKNEKKAILEKYTKG